MSRPTDAETGDYHAYIAQREAQRQSQRVLLRRGSRSMPAAYFVVERMTIEDVASVVTAARAPRRGRGGKTVSGEPEAPPLLVPTYASPLYARARLGALEQAALHRALVDEREAFFTQRHERESRRGEVEHFAATRLQARVRAARARTNSSNRDAYSADRRGRASMRRHLVLALAATTDWAVRREDVAARLRAVAAAPAAGSAAATAKALQRRWLADGADGAAKRHAATAAIQARTAPRLREAHERRANAAQTPVRAAELLQTVWRRRRATVRVAFRRRRMHFVAAVAIQRTARRRQACCCVAALRQSTTMPEVPILFEVPRLPEALTPAPTLPGEGALYPKEGQVALDAGAGVGAVDPEDDDDDFMSQANIDESVF
ncbi:hypothetical protein M885DRAFT_512631 [Pelagophyceae sp. CCMP2097]|nr:hypothetical protein M885DRAFT_512631 [Pelagophyceae sp. CCMP2097]